MTIGQYRAIETAPGCFIVQCVSNVNHDMLTWRTVVDASKLAVNGLPVPLTFGTLEAAQQYVDAVRRDAATYPIIHSLK